MENEIDSYRKTSLNFLGYVKDILGDDVVPPLSKPWKQAWGYMKGLFVKEEQELEELPHDERKRKWQRWKKQGPGSIQEAKDGGIARRPNAVPPLSGPTPQGLTFLLGDDIVKSRIK